MTNCPKCQTPNSLSSKFCESCGESFHEFQELDDQLERMLLGEAKKAAIALAVVGGIQLVLPMLMGIANVVTYGIAGVFLVLAVWCLRAPFLASAVGLGVFIALHVLEAVADPSSIPRGLLMKVIVIAALVSGIRNGLKHRQFKAERGS